MTLLQKLITTLHQNELIKTGTFQLKSGQTSSIYIDLRASISYPIIYKEIVDILYNHMSGIKYDFLCGVPYSGLMFASAIAYQYSVPMLMQRKEQKEYGTKKIIEGNYFEGAECVVIEDVVTTGSSILETIKHLENCKIVVKHVVCFLDRSNGKHNISGYKLHSALQLSDIEANINQMNN